MSSVKQAVLLAAGESSRFYPYNLVGHKSLIELGGSTLILKTIESLKKSGVESVVIVEGKEKHVSKALSDQKIEKVKLTFVTQDEATGMGDALLLAQKHLDPFFFLLNAYHFECDLFLKDMGKLVKKETDIVLLTKKEKDTSQFGSITQKNGKTVISEKDGASDTRIVGMYVLTTEFVKTLQKEDKTHYSFEKALSAYSENFEIVLYETKENTLSLKFPWDVLGVKDYILETIKPYVSKKATVSKKAVITGNVYIEDGAKVMDGAVITGNAYIGRGAFIGNNAILRNGVMIEAKSVVGANMEVKNAVMMKGSTTHSGFLGDSVVGEGTKIAAGFATANVRLDRQEIMARVKEQKVSTKRRNMGAIIGSNTAMGIKVGTMPGVIIGNSVIIGPGTTVMENIPDGVSYYTEFKKIVKK